MEGSVQQIKHGFACVCVSAFILRQRLAMRHAIPLKHRHILCYAWPWRAHNAFGEVNLLTASWCINIDGLNCLPLQIEGHCIIFSFVQWLSTYQPSTSWQMNQKRSLWGCRKRRSKREGRLCCRRPDVRPTRITLRTFRDTMIRLSHYCHELRLSANCGIGSLDLLCIDAKTILSSALQIAKNCLGGYPVLPRKVRYVCINNSA